MGLTELEYSAEVGAASSTIITVRSTFTEKRNLTSTEACAFLSWRCCNVRTPAELNVRH